MKIKKERAAVPYSCLIDNIKVLLIFLVVFNHIIAFNLVKVDTVVRYVWYAITIFHMPAFVFISGYLSKKPQNVLKNFKNLLIPYVLGYTLTWYSQIWLGRSVDYEILRPTGSVMWYILALFIYRLTIEALGKIRFIVPLSILLHYGQEPDRNLPHSCHPQESWCFSRSLLRGISGRVNISQRSVNLRENGSWWQSPESFCGRYRII